MTRLLWSLLALTLAVFLALVYLSYGRLMTEAGTVFDDQLAGYSVPSARVYLASLTAEQTALYLGTFRRLDTALPLLLASTLILFIWHHTRGLMLPMRVLTALTPCVYLVLDLRENALVAVLLKNGPQASVGAILQASAYTVGKFISLTLALLLCVWAWRLTPKVRYGS